MQGLADGYFVIPYTIGAHLAGRKLAKVTTEHAQFRAVEAEVRAQVERLLHVDGKRSVDSFHRDLGLAMWDFCGMGRNEAGLNKALGIVREQRERYWSDVRVLGENESLNQSLEKAGRVADFFELAELMIRDAQHRRESCGGHFREEFQTEEGEAKRDDENFCYVAAWEHVQGAAASSWNLHAEPLKFEEVHLTQRSYK
jgi:succinate dehydrogenase / fumarate reductase flavoprotein subunit